MADSGSRTNNSHKRAKIPKGTFKRLLSYIISIYPFHLLLVTILIIVSVFCNIRGALFLENLIDGYLLPMLASSSTNFTPLLHEIIKMAGIYLLGITSGFTYSVIMVFVSQGILKRLRNDMFDRMEDFPINYFDTHAHGDIMSIYINDIDTLQQMIGQSIPQMISSTLTIIVTLITMIRLSIPLTIITLIMVVVTALVTGKIGGLSSGFFKKRQESLGKLNAFTEEMINGQKVIKVFSHEQISLDSFKQLNSELCESATQASRYSNSILPFSTQIGNLNYVFVSVAGGAMALSGFARLTLGKLAAFLSLNRSFNVPILQISQQVNYIIMALAGYSRISAFLNEETEADNGDITLVNVISENDTLKEVEETTGTYAWKRPSKDGYSYEKLIGNISLKDVVFSYDGERTILHNISLNAEPGQKVAFVGATGAGKTTITNLINHFYDIQSGEIQFDNIDISNIKKKDLRHSLGAVLQDIYLFTGTVEENIRYGKLDATREEVINAAKLANADSFIRRLPNGYDTVLTNGGSSLSQGQRQLLSIARAAIADPPFLILDEATSSIDTRTERIVQDGMDALMKGRTTFVIAHRLSTIKNADCIMVMNDGHIIESGKHEELLSKQGLYYKLYTGKIYSD